MPDFTKQEMEDAEVITLTVREVRSMDTGHDLLDTILDEAQAPVFMGDAKRALVIVAIVADK